MKYVVPIVAVASVVTAALPARAVILLDTPTRNNTAPSGALAGSGWQWQGQINAFLGTPISSRHFITAQHVFSGEFGLTQPFTYHGQTYAPEAFTDIPGTDLRVYRINGSFNSWAPLYDRSIDGNEVGKPLVVFGRGTQRGEAIYRPTPPTPPGMDSSVPVRGELRGWRWSTFDSVQSWGQNTVTEIIDFGIGDTLYYTFDNPGGPNEAMLSVGDSGGGVFIQSPTGQWKLAGINFSVDAPVRFSETGEEIYGAVFDAAGMYVYNPPSLFPDEGQPVPLGSYSSSISSNLPAILNAINIPTTSAAIPEPAVGVFVLGTTLLMLRSRNR